MALRRGFGGSGTISKQSFGKGPRTFYMKQGEETTVVLLDDICTECVRHCMFLKGDGKGNSLRETCFHFDPGNPAHKDDAPQHCQGCNGMLRYDRIARKHFLYLTLIDERAFTIEGKTYKDMKRLLELSKEDGDIFERRRKAEGGLVGAKFQVYRGKSQRSSKHGSEWKFLGFVYNKAGGEDVLTGLARYFWQSPAIPAIRENHQKLEGKALDHQGATHKLVTPYNYEELMGSHDKASMAKFVAYYEAAVGARAAVGAGGGGGGYVAPPMPGGMAAPATMPAGAAPQTYQAPAAAPHIPPRDQQGYQAPPPPQQMASPQQSAAPPPQQSIYAGTPWEGQQAVAPQAAPAQAALAPAPAQQQVYPGQQAVPAQPQVPDPASAGGPGYSPPPFPGAVVPPSQQAPAAPAPQAANYEFGAPAQAPAPTQPAQASSDDFGLA